MQISLDLPDNLKLSETDIRTELAIVLFQQKILLIEQAANLINLDVDDFYQLLIDRPVASLANKSLNDGQPSHDRPQR